MLVKYQSAAAPNAACKSEKIQEEGVRRPRTSWHSKHCEHRMQTKLQQARNESQHIHTIYSKK